MINIKADIMKLIGDIIYDKNDNIYIDRKTGKRYTEERLSSIIDDTLNNLLNGLSNDEIKYDEKRNIYINIKTQKTYSVQDITILMNMIKNTIIPNLERKHQALRTIDDVEIPLQLWKALSKDRNEDHSFYQRKIINILIHRENLCEERLPYEVFKGFYRLDDETILLLYKCKLVEPLSQEIQIIYISENKDNKPLLDESIKEGMINEKINNILLTKALINQGILDIEQILQLGFKIENISPKKLHELATKQYLSKRIQSSTILELYRRNLITGEQTREIINTEIEKLFLKNELSFNEAKELLGVEILQNKYLRETLELYLNDKNNKERFLELFTEDTLKKLDISQIIILYKKGKISEDDIKRILGEKVIQDNAEEFIKILTTKELIEALCDSQISNRQLKKNGIDLNVLEAFKSKDIDFSLFLKAIETKKVIVGSEELYKLYSEDHVLTAKEVFKLIQEGYIEEEKILQLYKAQKIEKSADLFPEVVNNEKVQDNEFLEYYNFEKIFKLYKEGKIDEEFIKFFREIMPEDKKEKEEYDRKIKEEIEKYLKEHRGTDKKEIVKLYQKGLLDFGQIVEFFDAEDIFNLYDEGKLTLNDITNLYYTNKISKEIFETIISEEDLVEYEANGKIELGHIFKTCYSGKVNIEVLTKIKERYIEANREEEYSDKVIQSVEDIFKGLDEKDEETRKKAIQTLGEYTLEGIISYDDLTKIQTAGIITQKEFSDQIVAIQSEKAIRALLAGVNFVGGNELEEKEADKKSVETETVAPKETKDRSFEETEKILNKFGTIRGIVKINQGPLKGYEIICFEKNENNIQSICLLEKTGRGSYGNATFVVPTIVAKELVETSNKKGIREKPHTRKVVHKNWDKNLQRAIEELIYEINGNIEEKGNFTNNNHEVK